MLYYVEMKNLRQESPLSQDRTDSRRALDLRRPSRPALGRPSIQPIPAHPAGLTASSGISNAKNGLEPRISLGIAQEARDRVCERMPSPAQNARFTRGPRFTEINLRIHQAEKPQQRSCGARREREAPVWCVFADWRKSIGVGPCSLAWTLTGA